MIGIKKIREMSTFFVVGALVFLGLHQASQVSASQNSSATNDSITQASTQCNALDTTDYMRYLETADSTGEVLFAGCGGFM